MKDSEIERIMFFVREYAEIRLKFDIAQKNFQKTFLDEHQQLANDYFNKMYKIHQKIEGYLKG